jgi:hypothetical protein
MKNRVRWLYDSGVVDFYAGVGAGFRQGRQPDGVYRRKRAAATPCKLHIYVAGTMSN